VRNPEISIRYGEGPSKLRFLPDSPQLCYSLRFAALMNRAFHYSLVQCDPLPGRKGEIMDENYQQDSGQKYGDIGGTGTSGSASGTAARLKEQISDKAADVKERVTDFGRKTADKIDASRGPAADSLNRTASATHAQSSRVRR